MRVAALCAISLLLPLLGCASDRQAVDRRLAGLRDDIARLQTENDRLAERVDALEGKGVTPAAPSASENKITRPPLKVVKLMPGDAQVAGTGVDSPELLPDERVDAPGSRPVIRVRGKGDSREESRGGAQSVRPSAEDSK